MRTNIEIIKSYTNYLKGLKHASNTELFQNFDKMYNYLLNKVEGKLYVTLLLDCVNKTLNECDRRQLRFKTEGCNWNGASVERCFKLLNNMHKYEDRDDSAFFVNFHNLIKLLNEEPSPNLRLYLWAQYRKTNNGRNFLQSELRRTRQLLQAATEEEIQCILQGKIQPNATGRQETALCCDNTPKVDNYQPQEEITA